MTKHRHIYRQKRTAVFILLAAVLICAAVCRRSGGEEAEPEREKGLTAYVLRADTAIYMEFGVRNEFLRALHGGELSGELLLSGALRRHSRFRPARLQHGGTRHRHLLAGAYGPSGGRKSPLYQSADRKAGLCQYL